MDNKSAIDFSKHPTSHSKSKHIETKFHYIWEHVRNGNLETTYCRLKVQLANVLTKVLKCDHFKNLRKQIGVSKLNNFGEQV